tara:strand:+ start:1339 stop:2067 length:729 start_codon:yes stop_codon:yes gene_type:complete
MDPHIPSHWTEGYVVANNIRIHCWRTGGDKPPMVLAHGCSDDGLCWTAVALELEDRYDVILADARAFGRTDLPSHTESADVQVEDLAGFISALELAKPILMGHSMGSLSVASFSARYPDIPRASILVDPRLVPRTPKAQTACNSVPMENRVQYIMNRDNTNYQELFDFQKEYNPRFSFLELHFWALSKQQHHSNTAYRSLGDRPQPSDIFAKTSYPTLIIKADDQGELSAGNESVASNLKNN